MLKKFLLSTLMLIGSISLVNAQDFKLDADTLIHNTSGTDDIILMINNGTNLTADSLIVNWKIMSWVAPDTNWKVVQFCDNVSCRGGNSPAILSFAQDQTGLIGRNSDPLNNSMLEAGFTVPVIAANGTGVLRVNFTTSNTTIIGTYIINKTPTGISQIAVNDSRVNIYPNPAQNNVIVYAEKSLNASKVSIVSITGQTVYNAAFNADKEAESISINALSKGTYLVRVTDNKGQLITSRKFIKN